MKMKNYTFFHKKCYCFVYKFVVWLFLVPKLGSKYCLKMEKEAQLHLKTMKTVKGFCMTIQLCQFHKLEMYILKL